MITTATPQHLALQIDCLEREIERDLALGVSAQSTDPEATFTLAVGERLTLVPDGVVEAR
ncbi:MAG TPA: hypothetical protein VMU48_08260 [Terracidiphilus sp.]|nr:hypothetical protein [Terracidiphilus sp.]